MFLITRLLSDRHDKNESVDDDGGGKMCMLVVGLQLMTADDEQHVDYNHEL